MLRTIFNSTRGAGLVEYALLSALIASGSATVVKTLGDQGTAHLITAADRIGQAGTTAAAAGSQAVAYIAANTPNVVVGTSQVPAPQAADLGFNFWVYYVSSGWHNTGSRPTCTAYGVHGSRACLPIGETPQ